jgi:hypothetical protein
MVAGSALQAYNQVQAGNAANDAAQYNVAMGDLAAADAAATAEDEKQLLAHKFLQEKATGRAEIGASGVKIGTGSGLDWENTLIETFISDKAAIDEGTARTVSGISNQQELEAAQGRGAQRAGQIGAGASLLSGAGRAGAAFYQPTPLGESSRRNSLRPRFQRSF